MSSSATEVCVVTSCSSGILLIQLSEKLFHPIVNEHNFIIEILFSSASELSGLVWLLEDTNVI